MRAIKHRLFAGLFLIVGIAVFISARGLPPPVFDPLGSGRLPQTLAIILSVLAVLLMVLPRKANADENSGADKKKEYVGLTAGVVLLFAVYVFVMQFEILSFVTATIVFLVATMTLMVAFDPAAGSGPKSWVITATITLVMSFGQKFMFTEVLVVNLP